MRRIIMMVAAAAMVASVARPAGAQFENVGTLAFPTSASGEAQQHFLRGVAILHSFGWKQAIDEFQAAQKLQPDFAMAYWGETLCYNHPLMAEADAESPRKVLARLGATRAERLAKAPTDREKGFLSAVEALWSEGDWRTRRVAYMDAMARLYERYPDDREVAAFYAVALLSGSAALNDDTFRHKVRAGALALGLFAENPSHPGAPHYVIHAFDDPIHAPLALEAAFRYAEIAPAVSHARHMPTHIFIQHGMWDYVSRENQLAHDVAMSLWAPGDSVGDAVHSLDWGQYGDLQKGDYAKARVWIERLERLAERSNNAARAANSIPLLQARYIVESEEWKTMPVTASTSDHLLLAAGISAIRLGDLATAEQAEAALRDKAEKGGTLVKIMYREVAALVRLKKGQPDEATRLMDEACDVALGMSPPNGAADPVKPEFELYGEILLELDRPAEALEKFEASLLRTPNRARSLLGAARAAARSGDRAGARAYYTKLMGIWQGQEGLAGYQEARGFVGTSQE